MKILAFNLQTLVACTLALCAAPLWAQSTAPANASTTQAPAETTAQCQARVTAEYDAKIAKAQAEGEAGAKKVALFTRKESRVCGELRGAGQDCGEPTGDCGE